MKQDTLWRIKDAEELLAKRISKQEVINIIESLDAKLEQCHTNLENKLLDRLLKAYKAQQSQIENLQQYHDDKIKDLQQSIKNLNDRLDSSFVKNERFLEVRQTANQLRDKLDDELEIVARNIRENKDKMGEMKKRFELAMEKLGKITLEDLTSQKSNLSLSPEREYSEILGSKLRAGGY